MALIVEQCYRKIAKWQAKIKKSSEVIESYFDLKEREIANRRILYYQEKINSLVFSVNSSEATAVRSGNKNGVGYDRPFQFIDELAQFDETTRRLPTYVPRWIGYMMVEYAYELENGMVFPGYCLDHPIDFNWGKVETPKRGGQLEKLWEKMQEKREKLQMPIRQFNAVYGRMRVEAFKLRRSIFETRQDRAKLGQSAKQKCRNCVAQDCEKCLINTLYKNGVKLEVESTNKLLDIYTKFIRFINREIHVPTKFKQQTPMLGVWLRLKGYNELLREFNIWVRSPDANRRKCNKKARDYIRDCRLGFADHSGYYAYLDDGEAVVEEDQVKPRLLSRSKPRSAKCPPDTQKRDRVDVEGIAFWLAHTRSQRAIMLAAMGDKERVHTLKYYLEVKEKHKDAVDRWRTELVARKYRQAKEKKLVVATDYRKEVRKVVLSKLKINSRRYVVSCDVCANHAIIACRGHVPMVCSSIKCKNYSKDASKVTGASIEKGSVIPYNLYEKKTAHAFEFVDLNNINLPIGYNMLAEKGSVSIVSEHTRCNHDENGVCVKATDVQINETLVPVEDRVTVLGESYNVDKKVLAWYKTGNVIYYQVCRGFHSTRYLVTGTPVFNSKEELVTIISSSNSNVYSLVNANGKFDKFISNKTEYWSRLMAIAGELDCILMLNFHSTRKVQQAANTASALAEARVFSAVAAGHMANVKSSVEAINDLQKIAEQKVARALNSNNINQVVRRKKKNKPIITTTLAVIALAVLGFVGSVVAIAGHPSDDLAQMAELLHDLDPYSEVSCNKFYLSYSSVKTKLGNNYYTEFKDTPAYIKLSEFISAFELRNSNKVASSVQWLLSAYGYPTVDNRPSRVSHGAQICLRTQRGAENSLDKRINIKPVVTKLDQSLEKEEEISVKVNEAVHLLHKREAEIKEIKDNADWVAEFGKNKKDIIECLMPITGDYSGATHKNIEEKLKENFTNIAGEIDYDHKDCAKVRTYYTGLTFCMKGHLFPVQYGKVISRCTDFQRCKTSIREVAKLLQLAYGKSILAPAVTHESCRQELAKLENKFKTIKMSGHFSGTSIVPDSTKQCSENPNWKADGWLAGISGSCVSGVEESSWRVRGCIDMPTKNCINQPDFTCHLAWSNIVHKGDKILTNSHKNDTKKKCCSLHCFNIDDVYESFSNQPLCSSCILPYSPIFWTEQCLLNYRNEEITSLSITQSRTTFEILGKGQVICNNAWHFKVCCGGKGPAPYNVIGTFKDKHCVCQQKQATIFDIIWKKMNIIRLQFASPIHMFLFFVIFLVFISMRGLGLTLLVLYFSWLVVSVEGACSVENLVPVDSTSTTKGQNGLFSQVKVKPGQCFSVGDATVEIVSIELVNLYNFLRVVPYHIKPVCQLLDWGCPLGKSDGVYERESDCYSNCVPGLRQQWKDSEYDWIGDKCFLNGRVATRYDVCFSYGLPNTFVELYTRLSGSPILKLKVKFHGIGFEAVGNIETSNLDQDAPVTIIDVVAQPLFWPEMITYRLGKYLCSYHYVESAETCNSGDIFKPTDIDVECLGLSKKWDTAHGGYELTFKKRDFENQLHNYFVDCGLNFEVDNNVTTLSYKQSVDWIEFKVLGNNFKFAKEIPFCTSLNNWKIESNPGLTYYHRRTQISFENLADKCKIHFNIEGCISTNGNLIVLSKLDKKHIVEYWCGSNSTGTAQIELAEGKVVSKDFKVLNNFLPHKNSLRNNFEKVIRAASYSDFKNWIGEFMAKIDVIGVYGMLSSWMSTLFSLNWAQVVIGVILVYIAYANFIRGKIIAFGVCLALIWVIFFTKMVFAAAVHHTGKIGFVSSIGDKIAALLAMAVAFNVDVVGLIVFVSKMVWCSTIWFGQLLGCYNVLTAEALITKYCNFAGCIIIYYYFGFWLALVIFIAINFRQLCDRMSVISGCENIGLAYNNVVCSVLTSSFVSTEDNRGAEIDDPFSFEDINVDPTQVRLSQLSALVKCGKGEINVTDTIVLPSEVLSYRFCIIRTNGVIISVANEGSLSIAISSHCTNLKVEESIVFSGDSQILRNRACTVDIKLGPGMSGLPIEREEGIEWFVGMIENQPQFTSVIKQQEMDIITRPKVEFELIQAEKKKFDLQNGINLPVEISKFHYCIALVEDILVCVDNSSEPVVSVLSDHLLQYQSDATVVIMNDYSDVLQKYYNTTDIQTWHGKEGLPVFMEGRVQWFYKVEDGERYVISEVKRFKFKVNYIEGIRHQIICSVERRVNLIERLDVRKIQLPQECLLYEESIIELGDCVIHHFYIGNKPHVQILGSYLKLMDKNLDDNTFYTSLNETKNFKDVPTEFCRGIRSDFEDYDEKGKVMRMSLQSKFHPEWTYGNKGAILYAGDPKLMVHGRVSSFYDNKKAIFVHNNALFYANQGVVEEFGFKAKNIWVTSSQVKIQRTDVDIVNDVVNKGNHPEVLHIPVRFKNMMGCTTDMPVISSEETFIDPYGYRYEVVEHGLKSDICWPKHVVPNTGVEVCNDLMLQTRNSLVSVASMTNNWLYTSIDDKRISVKMEGTVWWPSRRPTDKPQPIRVQFSRYFKYQGYIKSGTLILANTSCVFAGTYYPVSCVTKSFKNERGERCYVVASPGDQYYCFSWTNASAQPDGKWACAAENESLGVTALHVQQTKTGSMVNFVNKNKHVVYNLKQTCKVFPIDLVEHSTKSEIKRKMNQSPLRNNTEFKQFIERVDVLEPCEQTTFNYMIENYNKLMELGIIKGRFAACFFKRMSELLERHNNDLIDDFILLNDVPKVPRAVNLSNTIIKTHPYVCVLAIQEPAPWSRTQIELVVEPDLDRHSIEVSPDGWSVKIVSGVEDILEKFKNFYNEFVTRGQRFIILRISGPNLQDIHNSLQDNLLVPSYFALSSCVLLKSDNVSWIKDQLEDVFIIGSDDIKTMLRSEWIAGDFGLDSINEHEEHCLSAKAWSMVVASPSWNNRKIDISVGVESTDIEQLGIVRSGEMISGLVRNCISRGSFFYYKGSFVTNWHVTKARPVFISSNGFTFKFDRPVYSNKTLDICMYGKKIEFDPVSEGEVVTAFNASADFGLHYVVSKKSTTLQGRGNSAFLKLLPISIDNNGGAKIIKMPFCRGMSGSPIVNSKGVPVGVFGLGMMQKVVLGDQSLTTAVGYSGTGELRLDNISFFDQSTKYLINHEGSCDSYYYCNAPTGTGKTTILPAYLVLNHHQIKKIGCKVLILQPNVTSVINCSGYLDKVLSSIGVSKSDCKVGFEVGLRNTVSSNWVGDDRDTKSDIVIKTYGKNYESWNKMSDYDYILMDEVHVSKDASVVSTIVRFQTNPTMFPRAKVLYLSATHLNVDGGVDIAQGETLSSTPRRVTKITWEVCRNEPLSKPPVGTHVVFDKSIIKGMPHDCIKLDMRNLTEGLVLFFCATRRDCERGAAYSSNLGMKTWAYHGESSQKIFEEILNHAGTGWIFATDIIQQSVTLPRLKTVVDFMIECRPKVVITQEPLYYKCTIEMRTIDTVTQVQRQGRVGRTCDGTYISGIAPVQTRTIEDFVLPEVVLKLLDGQVTIMSVNTMDKNLESKIKNLNWLSPSLITKSVPRNVTRMYTGRVFIDYANKLRITANKDFDRVKWYIRPFYPEEEITYYTGDVGRSVLGDNIPSFWHDYNTSCLKLSMKQVKELIDQCFLFASFKDPFDSNLVKMDYMSEISLNDIMSDGVVDSVEQAELAEQNLPLIATAITGIACVYAVFEKIMDKYTSRIVSHVSSVPLNSVTSVARYLAKKEGTFKMDDGISTWNLFHDVKGWVYSSRQKLFERFKGPSGVQQSADFFVSLSEWFTWLESQLCYYIGTTDGSSYLSLVLASGSVLGTLFRDLEDGVGRPMAMLIAIACTGMVGFLTEIKVAAVFSAAFFTTQVFRAVASTFGSHFRSTNHAGTTWAGIISVASGVAIGMSAKNLAIATTTNQAARCISESTLASRSSVGHIGIPILLVRHMYHIVKGGGSTESYLVAGASAVGLLFECGAITVAYAAVLGVFIFVVEYACSTLLDKFINREYSAPEGGAFLRRKKEQLEAITSMLLNLGAVIVYPQSVISVGIGMIFSLLNGSDLPTSARENFNKFSGISPVLAVISNIIGFLNSDVQEQSFASIWSTINNITDKVFNSSVRCYFIIDFLSNAWATIKKFFKRALDCLTGGVVKSVGDNIVRYTRKTYWGSLVLGDEVSGEEPIIVMARDTKVNDYALELLKEAGLTSCDRYWLKLDPGAVSTNGSVKNNKLKDDLKKSGIPVTTGYRVKSKCPLSYYKITVGKLGYLVSDIVGSCTFTEDMLTAVIENQYLSVSVRFSITYDIEQILAIIEVTCKLGTLYWAIHITSTDEGCMFNIYEYGPTGNILDAALNALSTTTGLDISTKIAIPNPELYAWDTMYIGTRKTTTSLIRPIINILVKGGGNIIDHLMPSVKKYAQPSYIYDSEVIDSIFPTHKGNPYIRYWAGIFCAHQFRQIPFTEKYYYNCDYNFPYGHTGSWLTEHIVEPDLVGYNETIFGLVGGKNKNTAIMVTTNEAFDKYTMALFALNNRTSVRYSYRTLNGQWVCDYTVDGGIDAHSRCFLSVIRATNGGKYYKMVCSCGQKIEVVQDLEERNKILNNYIAGAHRIEADIIHLAGLFGGKAGASKGTINPVVEQTSPILSLISNEDFGKVVEMSESLLRKIFDILGLTDRTKSGFSNAITMADRLNYLLTARQLDVPIQTFESCQLLVPGSNWCHGFNEPISGGIKGMNFYTPNSFKPSVTTEEVMALYRQIAARYDNSIRNATIYRKGRFVLPTNVLKDGSSCTVSESRAFYKMQQLVEIDPSFFDSCSIFLDPACGYGGFEQFLATIYSRKAPRLAFVNTLLTGSHRVPDIEMLSHGNFTCVSCMHPSTGDGNLRRTQTLDNIFAMVGKVGYVDMVIYDLGEFMDTSHRQAEWWTRKIDVSLIESMCTLLKLLRKGGKMVLKWTGFFANGSKLLYPLLHTFKEIRAVKIGTSSFFSTEFYFLCGGFGKVNRTQAEIDNLYDIVGDNIYSQLCKARNIWFNPKNYEELHRNDWLTPIGGFYKHYVQLDSFGKPPEMQYNFTTSGSVVRWNGNWDERVELFKKGMSLLYSPKGVKKLRFVNGTINEYEKLYTVGRVVKKLPVYNKKKCYNGLISDLTWQACKMTENSSTVALTQVLEAQRKASIKKRLDVVAPIINPDVADELRTIMQCLTTRFGRSLFGKLRILDKESVLVMLNKQGATSIMSKDSNLEQFIRSNSNWYDICMKMCVDRWSKGQSSHCFFNVMHKNEPKKKANVESGKISLEKEKKSNYSIEELQQELEEGNNLNHRFIQYADEITRISHYIVLGSLIQKSNTQKLYKGTINGTPPYLVGNILRAAWDINSKEKFFGKDTVHHGFEVNMEEEIPEGDDTCGIIIDFSSLDITVSVAERMAEFDWCSQFYPEDYRTMLSKMFEEMVYTICVNHSGDIWLRAGQRGSGEIVTSLGNTLICIANIIRCVKRATGSTNAEVTRTVATIQYKVGSKVKVIEMMPYPTFGDGDDIVIVTSGKVASAFTKMCPEVLGTAGKIIRSGNKLGCTIVHCFVDLEFCSHRYEPIIIGKSANYIHKYSEVLKHRDDKNYKIMHLPTRPTADVLGKLRATLKRDTMFWNYEKMPKKALEVTRSKLMSYLLLYPHMRYVRILCLYGLSVVGDGTINIDKFKRRYPDVDASFGTIAGALNSVYGVTTLDDISLRNYRADYKDAEVLMYNASLDSNKVTININTVSARLSKFISDKKKENIKILSLDSKVLDRHQGFDVVH